MVGPGSEISARLPDRTSVATVLLRLGDGGDDRALAEALNQAFPGFNFAVAATGRRYFLQNRSVLAGDGSRVSPDLLQWLKEKLDQHQGDAKAVWESLKGSDFLLAEWHGQGVFAFAPTGPGAADFVQISMGRETEWRGGPVVDPFYRPFDTEDLLDPRRLDEADLTADRILAGPRLQMRDRPASQVVHLRSFVGRCGKHEREKREAKRGEMERKVLVRSDGSRVPFLKLRPDWFDQVPREVRFFQDWEESSAGSRRVYEHFAFEIHDHGEGTERHIGFVIRPHRLPETQLGVDGVSVHALMDRVEAIDREIGLPFGWFFLMVHGNRITPDVGEAIAAGLRAQRIRLPDRDAHVLLRWADDRYGF